jgi:carbonic anhydrase/acetyltransferase-like protein (isoleucine patch superfamily)
MPYRNKCIAVLMSFTFISLPLLELNASTSTHAKCPGETGYYFTNYRIRNPQKGGFVSNQAYVNDTDENVFIGPDAVICGSSTIQDQAKIYGNAQIFSSTVVASASVYENAIVKSGATIKGSAKIYGDATVKGSVEILENAIVAGNATVFNDTEDFFASVGGDARVTGYATVTENATIRGSAKIQGQATISGSATIEGNALVSGCQKIKEGVISSGTVSTEGPCHRVLTGSSFPESIHPYKNGVNEVVYYQLENFPVLEITFDTRTSVEPGKDYIVINGNLRYTGADLAGKKIRLVGQSFSITVVADNSNSFWGYKIIDVKGVSQSQLDQEANQRRIDEQQRQDELRRQQEEELRRQREQELLDDDFDWIKETFEDADFGIDSSNSNIKYKMNLSFISKCKISIQIFEEVRSSITGGQVCQEKTFRLETFNLASVESASLFRPELSSGYGVKLHFSKNIRVIRDDFWRDNSGISRYCARTNDLFSSSIDSFYIKNYISQDDFDDFESAIMNARAHCKSI